MILEQEDVELLKELCSQHEINFEKVLKLLDIERSYEFKDRRTGIYEALRGVLKNDLSSAEGNND